MSDSPPLRVLVVDDSPTVRAVLRRLFGRDSGCVVVGEAANGREAVGAVLRLGPDVVLMDIEMPEMDGYEATEQIMALCPTPIVVLSSLGTGDGTTTAFEALRRGAIEVLPKPAEPAGWDDLFRTLPTTLRLAAGARAVPVPTCAVPVLVPRPQRAALPSPVRTVRLVAIGASTGGPQAVHEFLSHLPERPPAFFLVVQHIAAGFEQGLADWLAGALQRDVALAADGERPPAGAVRIAPAGAHLKIADGFRVRLDAITPPRGGHRPSVDEFFLSCAALCARETAGVLLSGRGRDGAEGLAALRSAGGLALAQDEASSVVFGMPRSAVELGAPEAVLPPRGLAELLARYWPAGTA